MHYIAHPQIYYDEFRHGQQSFGVARIYSMERYTFETTISTRIQHNFR